jgi:hypothetical protein
VNVDRKTLLVVLMIVLASLTGCGIVGGSAPPGLTLIVDGEEVSAGADTYCWGGLCADGIFPPVIDTFVELPADGEVTLEFDRPRPDSGFVALDLFDTYPDADSAASMRLESVPDTITWTPGVPSGDYVLSVTVQWKNGNDAAYHLGVSVP